jgi:hypothetical protein
MPARIARRSRLQAGNRAPGSKRKAREAREYGIAAGAISGGLSPHQQGEGISNRPRHRKPDYNSWNFRSRRRGSNPGTPLLRVIPDYCIAAIQAAR